MSPTTSTTRVASCTKTHPRSVDRPPADFDASALPIIARHFFGVEPFRSIGEVAGEVVADIRFRRQVEHVHRLGPRAVGELLHEVVAGGNLDRALEAYERLTPDLLTALGGDRFPPMPIHELPS